MLQTPPPPKKIWYKWMMAALVSGFIFSSKANAQTKKTVGELICQTNPQLMGDSVKTQHIALGDCSIILIKENI